MGRASCLSSACPGPRDPSASVGTMGVRLSRTQQKRDTEALSRRRVRIRFELEQEQNDGGRNNRAHSVLVHRCRSAANRSMTRRATRSNSRASDCANSQPAKPDTAMEANHSTSDGAASSPPASIIRPMPGGLHRVTEVYGFVLWLSTFVFAAVWLAWAFTPDSLLHSLGITYYPDRFWAISLTAYGMLLLVCVPLLYHAWNMAHTLERHHINTIVDTWTRKQQESIRKQQREQADDAARRGGVVQERDQRYSIPDCVDIPLPKVNRMIHRSDRLQRPML